MQPTFIIGIRNIISLLNLNGTYVADY